MSFWPVLLLVISCGVLDSAVGSEYLVVLLYCAVCSEYLAVFWEMLSLAMNTLWCLGWYNWQWGTCCTLNHAVYKYVCYGVLINILAVSILWQLCWKWSTDCVLPQVWDVEHNKMLRNMRGHAARVGSLCWNNYILSRSVSGPTVRGSKVTPVWFTCFLSWIWNIFMLGNIIIFATQYHLILATAVSFTQVYVSAILLLYSGYELLVCQFQSV